MLKQSNRLTKRLDFENVYHSGSFFSFRGITIHILKTKNLSTRVGFVVSKAFSKSSVERNRAKRMMRAAMKEIMPNIAAGYDIVINYKPREHFGKTNEVTAIFVQLFKRHRLLK